MCVRGQVALRTLVGDPVVGVFSPSVQRTLLQVVSVCVPVFARCGSLVSIAVLEKYTCVESLSFSLPNIHFMLADFKDMPPIRCLYSRL